MDLFKDFFDAVKDRFKSPLFASFILAWLIFNWKVPIALFFQSFDDIKHLGFNSYMQYIDSSVDSLHGVWYPLLTAILYTFGFPLIRNLNLFSNGWFRTWGYNFYYKITQTRTVPLTRLLETQGALGKKESELSTLITTEKVVVNERDSLKGTNSALNYENNELKRSLSELKIYTSTEILVGKKWFLNSKHLFSPEIAYVEFTQTEIIFTYTSPLQADSNQPIANYFFNPLTKQCYLAKGELTPQNKYPLSESYKHPLLESTFFFIEFVSFNSIKITSQNENFIFDDTIDSRKLMPR